MHFVAVSALFIGLSALPASAPAASTDAACPEPDCASVRSAVLDYVNALYRADPTLIQRSVAPDLVKFGKSTSRSGYATWSVMDYDQLVRLAERYNRDGKISQEAERSVEILDVQSHIASAKLVAAWGIDYILLAKRDDGKWMIRQVVWQDNEQ